jgi:hypothetical protein
MGLGFGGWGLGEEGLDNGDEIMGLGFGVWGLGEEGLDNGDGAQERCTRGRHVTAKQEPTSQ